MLDALAEGDNSVLTATDEIPTERNLVLPVTQESEETKSKCQKSP